MVIFAPATVLAFVLLCDSRFNFHCYAQCEAMPTQKSARKCAATSCAKDYNVHSLRWITQYTHRRQSYQNNLQLHMALYARVYTHTHSDCTSRNWVLKLAGVEILWEEEGFQFGFKRWQCWAVSKVLWEWISNVGSKAREIVKAMSLAFVLLLFF